MGQEIVFDPPEGIHLGLPERFYFAADAIGSSDLKVLLRDPATWWYASRHNPWRKIRDSKVAHLRKGNALHTLILEGKTAYERGFAVEPLETEHNDKARSAADIKEMLKKHGVTPPETWDKSKLIDVAKRNKLGSLCWDVIQSDFKTALSRGRAKISRAEDLAFQHMAELVHLHPDLGPWLKSGLTEVSIFWRRPDDPDTLLRARLDKVSGKLTGDLKTLSNWKAQSTRHATIRQITEFEYDLQRRFYDEARARAREFIAENKIYVYDQDGEPAALLAEEDKVLADIMQAETWLWVWVFYQVRSDEYGKERAPVLIPWVHQPQGRMWDQAGEKVEAALGNYRAYRERYGFETPWAEIEPCAEIADEQLGSLLWKGIPE
ncbi:MAG: hypothetical protein GC155_06120 [Alphaproteobacteria bacterium]|nr:hypothetical protein [Alphaproteobacteria bacterium]